MPWNIVRPEVLLGEEIRLYSIILFLSISTHASNTHTHIYTNAIRGKYTKMLTGFTYVVGLQWLSF